MKFSVTIPAYKARFLRECIESVLAQTYRDFELIIVNDVSPEDLGSIVRSFDDPRIRYSVNERNCGAVNVVDNWNHDTIVCRHPKTDVLRYSRIGYLLSVRQVRHKLTEKINIKWMLQVFF